MDVIARLRDQLADITNAVTVLHQRGEDILALTHVKLRETFTVPLNTDYYIVSHARGVAQGSV